MNFNSKTKLLLTDTIVFVLCAAYMLLFTYLSWSMLDTFHLNNPDLAASLRKLWGFNNGIFTNPLVKHGAGFWDDHLEPAFLVLIFLAKIFPPLWVLLLSQSLAIAAMGWIVYRSAKQFLPLWVAAIMALVLLCNPALHNANLVGFRMMVVALPFLAWFLDGVLRQKINQASLALFLALLCREEVAGVMLLWGFYCWNKHRRLAVGQIVLSLLWFIAAILLKNRGLSAVEFEMRFSLAEPFAWVASLPDKGQTALWLFASFGFLSFLGARVLVWSVFTMLLALFSKWYGDFVFSFHFLSWYVPFFAYAAIFGMQRLAMRGEHRHRWVTVATVALLVGGLLTMWWHTRAPWGKDSSMALYRDDLYSTEARQILTMIAPQESVYSNQYQLAQLAMRPYIFQNFHLGCDAYILPYSPINGDPALIPQYRQRIDIMIRQFGYQPVFQGKMLWLLKRKS